MRLIPVEEWEELSALRRERLRATPPVTPPASEEKKAEDDQRWWLRYTVAGVVVLTLWVELMALFWIVVWQGRGGEFKLNDWLIGVVVGGVLIQTIWCLQNIAAHLFPEGEGKMGSLPKTPGVGGGKE